MTKQLHFHFSLLCIGEGNGNPLQCSCLENPRDGGACWAAVYGVTQSRTRLKRLSSSSSRLYPCSWNFPGKNSGVGCHFLLQCMKVKSESEVAHSSPTLSDPMDCSLPAPLSMGFSRQEYCILVIKVSYLFDVFLVS